MSILEKLKIFEKLLINVNNFHETGFRFADLTIENILIGLPDTIYFLNNSSSSPL